MGTDRQPMRSPIPGVPAWVVNLVLLVAVVLASYAAANMGPSETPGQPSAWVAYLVCAALGSFGVMVLAAVRYLLAPRPRPATSHIAWGVNVLLAAVLLVVVAVALKASLGPEQDLLVAWLLGGALAPALLLLATALFDIVSGDERSPSETAYRRTHRHKTG